MYACYGTFLGLHRHHKLPGFLCSKGETVLGIKMYAASSHVARVKRIYQASDKDMSFTSKTTKGKERMEERKKDAARRIYRRQKEQMKIRKKGKKGRKKG